MTCTSRFLTSSLTLLASLTAQNQALELTTGIDGGVAYPFDARMVPPTGITVEAWVTYDDSTIPTGGFYWPTVARQNVTPNQESWNLRVSAANTGNRQLQFIVRASTNALYNTTYTFVPGEFANWTHIAGTFDGRDIKLIVNGIEVSSFTIPITSRVANNGGELRVGNGYPVAPGNEAWNGKIDEVRIWPMARTAGEIANAMQYESLDLPSSQLVLPLNGSYNSLDGALVGTPYGTVAFSAGEPTIQATTPLVFNVGPPSSTCARQAELMVGSLPQVGNLDFRFWCVQGPTPAESPAGAAFFAGSGLTGVPVLGITLNIDPNTIITSIVQTPAGNALGNSSLALPIPNNPIFVGSGYVVQWIYLDATCGSQGFSASNGLLFGIQ